jgi:hypothetical protein
MTIEAVEVSRVVLEDRMQALESNLGGRIGTLETATKELTASIDRLEGRFDAFEGRFDGLEAQIAAREEVLDRRLS